MQGMMTKNNLCGLLAELNTNSRPGTLLYGHYMIGRTWNLDTVAKCFFMSVARTCSMMIPRRAILSVYSRSWDHTYICHVYINMAATVEIWYLCAQLCDFIYIGFQGFAWYMQAWRLQCSRFHHRMASVACWALWRMHRWRNVSFLAVHVWINLVCAAT